MRSKFNLLDVAVTFIISVIFKLILQIDIMNIFMKMVLMWMPQNTLMISLHWLK